MRIARPVAVLLFLGTGLLNAEPTKGQTYVFAAPLEALTLEKTNIWGVASFRATVTAGPNGAPLLNGNAEWMGAGGPVLSPFTLRKDKTDKKTGTRLLVLGSNMAELSLSLDSATVTNATLDLLLLPASDVARISDYETRAFTALSGRLFAGDLSGIPVDTRVAYLKDRKGAPLPSVGVAVYKERKYLSLDLSTGTTVYNTLQLNQTQRVARAISQDLLPELKRAEPLLAAATDTIFGVKILCKIPWKNFMRTYENGTDSLELYVPSEKLRLFMNADITSQAMIDSSVVIVDGNRIDVNLSQQ